MSAFSKWMERLNGLESDNQRGVDPLEGANAWLPEYLEDCNRHFGKLPQR